MKTDSIFYQIFLNFPHIFFELINQPQTNTQNYEFTSREVKQLSFRVDGLFLPTDGDSDQPLYLVEVQFQPDEDFYYRLFAELFLFLRQYQPPHPWRIVVIYPSRNMEREPHHQFGDILALNRVQRIYLDSLGETATTSLGVGVVKLVIEPENHAVNLAKSLITQAKEEINEPTIQQELIDLIETIIIYKLPQKTRKEIEAMLGLSELKKTKVYQEALAEGEEIGEQRGEQRGEQKGEQKAKLDAIPRMIGFGLKLEDIANLLNLPLEVVQKVAQAHNNDN